VASVRGNYSRLVLVAFLVSSLNFYPGAPRTGVLGTPVAAGQSIGSWDTGAEYQILALLNQERTSRGLARLRYDDRLTDHARQHSERMAQLGQLAHQFPGEPEVSQRLGSGGLHFDYSGENVALNESAAGAHQGLMNSPPHRANILSPNYNSVGIGVVHVGKLLWVTQDFADLLPETSAAEAEMQIARQFNQLRQSAGAGPLPVIANAKLRQFACDMASRNDLSPSKASALPNVARVVTFTVAKLTEMPQYLQQAATSAASGFSVGACFATSKTYTNAVYWVIVTTYF
jgi:uncharacterized protein YkwD